MPDQSDAYSPHDRHRSWGHGFAEFYADQFEAVVAYLMAQRTQESDARDIAQELFLSFNEKWDEVKEAVHTRAYVRTAARHRRIDYYRRPSNRLVVPVEHESLSAIRAPNEGFNVDFYDGFYADLDEVLRENLSYQQRRAVLLVAFGMKHSEIAAEMGLTMSTVATHIGNARQKLASSGSLVALLAGSYE
ncbi:sigma-70 family RNA polymerase sigma factor [Streptomyces sp. NBC_00513]|uniref:RNA polymerase sigma factor n=1 Tax=unclassified Streptomyces TaxID=2593676 RepID=UPI0022564247|nr:sigma-70 family RNA polymerase sigma factor [Streptomyces sp. NBC_00424]MCX5072689.1 sigma-70 family RNA polymerase sigma factor [Streptomyces sp. NBC_00424]MCX5073108.1 sigma-70 family RNA polymerase sigma factor [Streptomyces sp. NBC_00424]WUD43608.1 sigma-70 family RNA polymerase sigma factor [Streptomyces sp. NBC_00513]WUD43994.1 sigma-70 family RNA polymerase sigma factor [Streptomyces sp. NBC_00513]